MESLEEPKVTVIIVHGTWASPQPGSQYWYGLGSREGEANFASKLNAALEKREQYGRCWAHCKNNAEIFSWSGANAWVDRAKASSALAATINKLQADGWYCHIVAHSHGGNIVAEALPTLERGLTGRIVTLGTPYLDAMSPLAKRAGRSYTIWRWLTLLYVIFALSALIWWDLMPPLTSIVRPFFGIVCLLLVAVLLLWMWLSRWNYLTIRRGALRWDNYWRSPGPMEPFLLALGSPMDEAWQLLHHLREIANPLEIKKNLIKYLLDCRASYIERGQQTLLIQGATRFGDLSGGLKCLVLSVFLSASICATIGLIALIGKPAAVLSALQSYYGTISFATLVISGGLLIAFASMWFGSGFYSVLISPAVWAAVQVRAIAGLPSEVIAYLVRRRGWSLLQQLAFGLDGYRFSLPRVAKVPQYCNEFYYRYEDIPKAVEERALARRKDWIGRYFGEVSQALTTVVLTASDISQLIKMVENDLSLVHAAYYMDDECIERIADWLAGPFHPNYTSGEYEDWCNARLQPSPTATAHSAPTI